MKFARRAVVIGAVALLATTASFVAPRPAEAQISLNEVQPFGQVGLYAPMRDMGKLLGELPEGPSQLRAKFSTSATAAAGVEIPVHDRGVLFRLEASTTLGGGSNGQLAGCKALSGLEEEDAEVCRVVEASGHLRSLSGHAVLIRPVGPGRVFPFLSFGAGVRQYAFTPGPCTGDLVCEMHHQILEDQIRGTIHLGLGAKIDAGPVAPTLRVGTVISGYDAPGDRSRGEIQNDITASLGLSLAPRF